MNFIIELMLDNITLTLLLQKADISIQNFIPVNYGKWIYLTALKKSLPML